MKKTESAIEPEYIPFGDEWKAEINKFPKKVLVEMYRDLCIKLQEQREQFLNNMFK